MKSKLTPPNEKPTHVPQVINFRDCMLQNGSIAFGLAIVVDLFYFLLLHSESGPGAGWSVQLILNVFFGYSIAFISLLVWRRGGAWPFQKHPADVERNLINGLFLGVLLALLVMTLVFSLLAACAGDQVVDAFQHLKNVLLAQGGEAAYLGTKIIVVTAGLELTGKTESDPPR